MQNLKLVGIMVQEEQIPDTLCARVWSEYPKTKMDL